MSAAQRSKGQRAERQAAALIAAHTGYEVRRRVRQHGNDSDLEGVPGWSLEVKDHSSTTIGDVRVWWAQTVRQAGALLPALIYKRQRGEWRAVWPAAVNLSHQRAEYWTEYEWTAEGSIECWAAVVRECAK